MLDALASGDFQPEMLETTAVDVGDNCCRYEKRTPDAAGGGESVANIGNNRVLTGILEPGEEFACSMWESCLFDQSGLR